MANNTARSVLVLLDPSLHGMTAAIGGRVIDNNCLPVVLR
jgi:hypothetical protein